VPGGGDLARPLRLLYVVYWGAAEPLGQSLVLPAVRELSRRGIEVTLVTFEKPADLARVGEVAGIAARLEESGVGWVPLRYHKRPKLPATAFDLFQGFVRSVCAQLPHRPDIVHARTFIGGLVGAAAASALRVPLVHHAEGFYAEEQIDAGVWSPESRTYRVARRLESWLYGRAEGLVVLSEKARGAVLALPRVARRGTQVVVVPSCVDLGLFPAPNEPLGVGRLELVYLGNVEGRYLFDRVARFAAIASESPEGAHLHVLTRADAGLVGNKARAAGLPETALTIASVPHAAVPSALAGRDVGIHFLPRGRAEHGGSPTKIGEYWAAGLPVLVTPNVGDTDRIIAAEGVGMVLGEHSDDAYRAAADALRRLRTSPGLRARCRAVAEAHYALGPATDRQVALYEALRASR
jgi:glycosyltransferase involved in cell wall biosynthesis